MSAAPTPKSDHIEKHSEARAMARTCYFDAVEEAVKILKSKNGKAKTGHRILAALVIVIAAEWGGKE